LQDQRDPDDISVVLIEPSEDEAFDAVVLKRGGEHLLHERNGIVGTGRNAAVDDNCAECNSQKGEMPAESFLRLLYRDGRLTASELTGRLHAVEALAAGKLRPALGSEDAKDQRHHAPSR